MKGGIFRVPNPNDPSQQVTVSFPVSPWAVHGKRERDGARGVEKLYTNTSLQKVIKMHNGAFL